MADVRHSTLTGTELHEPKGMAEESGTGKAYISQGDGTGIYKAVATDGNATETTMEPKGISGASDQSIYIADGAGSGAWRAVTEFSGAMAITNNATPYALTAASDSTLATFSDYSKMTGFAAGELDKITFGSNGLTIPVNGGGIYLVDTYLTASTGVVNTNIAIKFAVNGASGVARRPRSFLATTGNFYGLSANGIVRFADGDVVELYIVSDKTTNILVQDCAFTLHKIGE